VDEGAGAQRESVSIKASQTLAGGVERGIGW
jgi:hypothetical protein